MGFDLTVTKGSVRLAEARILIRELLEFAVQMELEVIPLNLMVSGIIPDHHRLLDEVFEVKSEMHFPVSRPVEIGGEIAEGHINIHCPWRRSDAAAACDVVKLLSRHSDGLEARDDMGVWPDKDFTKWVNFANKWANALGGTSLHPDPTDNV